MTSLPRLLLPIAVCLPMILPAGAAAAKPSFPSITKVSPMKLGVGDTLTLRGKGFRSGTGRNTVVFKRDGGRAVFVKAGKATRSKISVRIPAKMLASLGQKSGRPVATRFRVRVLAGRFGRRFTAVKASPVIGPVARITEVKPADCAGDLVPHARDADDDNDLLSDTLEATLKTNACKRDSDGDGMSDAWEHESALDYNGRARPAPSRRPYPNALDPKDAAVDSDGDGLTNLIEYAAWATFGDNKLPLSYSGGGPATGGKAKPAAGSAWHDRDANGFLSDNERDADGDGIPNQDEGGVGPLPVLPNVTGFFADEYIALKEVREIVDVVPLYGPLDYVKKVQGTSWLDADSDGDTVRDGDDDQDGDGLANLPELLAELSAGPKDKLQRPLNPCVPSTDARLCLVGDDDIDNDGRSNRDDDDDDGDRLTDTVELQYGLNPFREDTDTDGAGDGFEFFSARDLNGSGLPFPGKRPYPNGLDKEDAGIDHDGDGLSLRNEFKAWKLTGSPVPLSYSDGNQQTGGGTTLDSDKDVDGDGATNYSEVSGPLSGPAYWIAYVKDNRCSDKYVESTYPGPRYEGLDFVDADSDGDGLLDGADDIDHDGFTNAQEGTLRRSDWCDVYVSVGPGTSGHGGGPTADRFARHDPFNPCKPVYSAACHKFVPLNYYVRTADYTEDWVGAQP